MTRVAVIIVNYNTGEEAVACAASAAADLAAVDSETIVVDNASSDGSVERLTGLRPGSDPRQTPLRVVANATNRGFAGGANDGIAVCDTPPDAPFAPPAAMPVGFGTLPPNASSSPPIESRSPRTSWRCARSGM